MIDFVGGLSRYDTSLVVLGVWCGVLISSAVFAVGLVIGKAVFARWGICFGRK